MTGSNGTLWAGAKILTAEQPEGRYLHYGVREFGMAGIMNGMALHGGIIPYGGTFFNFSDCAACHSSFCFNEAKVIYVLTHDSIGVGEDGPHINQLSRLLGLGRFLIYEYGALDVVETAVAWQSALEYQGPTALLLTRKIFLLRCMKIST